MAGEFSLEDDCVKYAQEKGFLVRKVAYVGRRRAPDRWFLRHGRWTIVEFKAEGEDATLAQAREHRKLREHGQEVYVIDNFEEFVRVLSNA